MGPCALRFDAVPRWSGLIHFQEVMNVSFTDGTKYEDISKVRYFLFYSFFPNKLTTSSGPCIRCAQHYHDER